MQSTLVSTDAAYWRRCKDFIKPGDKPLAFQRRTEFGCPYDCGLCPDHEQHSCLALIEITEHCNLTCPVCFAESSPARTSFTPLATIEKMLDALVAERGRAGPGADLRRRADAASGFLRDPRRGRAPGRSAMS